MYENHRKDITLQIMIITFEAFYMQANITFFTSCCSFHVTVATFRLSTLRYYPMHHTECLIKHFEVFPHFFFKRLALLRTNTIFNIAIFLQLPRVIDGNIEHI